MDIDLLSKMVKDLILDNEKVVLPGLGCFVAEMVPATFSDRGYTINPPYRRLYFRSHPDDGELLASLYAQSNKVDVVMADRILRDFLNELKGVLFARKTVVFPGLGRLRATKENNIFFVADENLDIYPIGFALETISMKSHEELQEKAVSALGQFKDMMEEMSDKPKANDTVSPAVEEVPAVGEEPVLGEGSAVEDGQEPAVEEVPVVKRKYKGLKISLWILLALALVVAAFFALDFFAPDLMDQLLYTDEELEILHYGK